jgi:hypothetical protein
MNSPTNPRSPSGFDLFVGQNSTPGADRERGAERRSQIALLSSAPHRMQYL